VTRPSKWARMDWPLLLNALALCAIGILNVYSGTRVHGVPGTALVTKQLVWILLGVGAFFAVYFLSDGFIEETANGFFIAVLLLLVVVLMAGRVRGGPSGGSPSGRSTSSRRSSRRSPSPSRWPGTSR